MYVKYIFLAAVIATVTRSEVHVVDVGEDGLRFEPQTINPKEGDTVIFHLYPRHNVVSTTFNQPCESNDNSWFSGPYDQTDDGKKKFVVNVTSENPVCISHEFFIEWVLIFQNSGLVLLCRAKTLSARHGGSLEPTKRGQHN